MGHKPYKGFEPKWYTEVAPSDSYRNHFKWGDPTFNKPPKEGLYKLVKKTFDLTDDDFREWHYLGLEKVKCDIPCALTESQIREFKSIVGDDNVAIDDNSRVSVCYGKTMLDILRLRHGIVENAPDAVIYPSTTEDVERIMAVCVRDHINLYVYGGGSSVTRGPEAILRRSVTLDLRRHFNKVVSFDEINQTITVQPGLMGPAYEKILNEAPKNFGTKCRYTGGHFPQSFEYSSVGGWVVTRGAGQNSTYYGKIEDIVVSQEYVTPVGKLKTDIVPRKACGPDVDQIMMGSEGTFGVLTEVTLKVFKYHPEDRTRFCFIFHSFEEGQKAMREVMQGEFGHPSAFRLSDEEETSFMLHLYGVEENIVGKMLGTFGYKPGERCLMLGFNDGDKALQKLIKRKLTKICKKHGAMQLPGLVCKSWEGGRFNDSYMRDNIQDFGIMIDTLECAVDWHSMPEVYKSVRAYCKSRPKTVCTTHISHCYEQGANLYFIFIAHLEDIDEFVEYHSGILDAIQKSGACMSHHHGIGKLFAPWLEGQIGTDRMEVLKTLKHHFDPDGILNPGGTIGLDLRDDQKVPLGEKWEKGKFKKIGE